MQFGFGCEQVIDAVQGGDGLCDETVGCGYDDQRIALLPVTLDQRLCAWQQDRPLPNPTCRTARLFQEAVQRPVDCGRARS